MQWAKSGMQALLNEGVATEHHREYETERAGILRSRLLALCAVLTLAQLMLASGQLSQFTTIIRLLENGADAKLVEAGTGFVFSLVQLTMLASVAWFSYRSEDDADRQLGLAFWLVVGLSALTLFSRGAVRIYVDPEDLSRLSVMPALSLLWVHLLACGFLPWSMREAIRPLIPIFVLVAIISIPDLAMAWWVKLVLLALVLVAGAPGVALCRWKSSRMRERFHLRVAGKLISELQRDLVDAREVHEALFPDPVTEGPIRAMYKYEPMRMVGGDFLFMRRVTAPGRGAPDLVVILFDVTGHGVGAALAVNRIHGEIERQLGQNPAATPNELLRGVNEYIHLTLHGNQLFASGVALRFGRSGRKLRWANAGHPPVFLRRVGGKVERLSSTCTMLGVLEPGLFEPDEQLVILEPGDRLLAYTDGVTEAADATGAMIGVPALQELIEESAPAPNETLIETVTDMLRRANTRRADDDQLIVELARVA